MKKFNLEAAKKGAKLCTRDGHPARIICYDAKGAQPLVALVTYEKFETPFCYHNDGNWWLQPYEHSLDLMMEDE